MRKQYLALAVGMLVLPVVCWAQMPDFTVEETTYQEVKQHFEREKAVYRYWVNEAVERLDNPDTPDIDESEWYGEEVEEQQEYDDHQIARNEAQGAYYESVQSTINQQSQECPEKQVCDQKIAMLEALAYKQELACQQYTGESLERCTTIVTGYREHAAEIEKNCDEIPDDEVSEACQELVSSMQGQLQDTASGYMSRQWESDPNRPDVSYEIAYPDESKYLDDAYSFNTSGILMDKINESGSRNMKDELWEHINNEQDVQDYYNRNFSNTAY